MSVIGQWHLGPLELGQPLWGAAGLAAIALSLWWSRRSLSLAGSRARFVAAAARTLVLAMVSVALAEPSIRDTSEKLAVTAVVDMSRSVPSSLRAEAERYVEQAAAVGREPGVHLLGAVTAAEDAYVQSLPSALNTAFEAQTIGSPDGTNLEEAVRMALAVQPADAASRLLLITDGNETRGSLLAAADLARARGVPVDVLPLSYRYESEVIVESVDTPATARAGEIINARITARATRAVRGRLLLLINGEPVRLGDGGSLGVAVELDAGTNTLLVPLSLDTNGPQEIEAVFEPETVGVDDAVAENNRASSVTFFSGPGRVLVLAEEPRESAAVLRALGGGSIAAEVRTPSAGPQSLVGLNAYDAVILCNVPAYAFSEAQLEAMRAYVEDSGGGLFMLGGPLSFGAGGWIGTPVEDVLPIQLDPPQTRRMPRGALVLIMHSVEMPEGRFYGEQTASAAVEALSRLDLVGIVEYNWSSGRVEWVHPIALKGDGVAVNQAIKSLTFGDMPDMAPSVQMAFDGLSAAQAGQKHAIIISDGDPSPPGRRLLQRYADAGITISTVGVFPHSGGPASPDLLNLKNIADLTGGSYYGITTSRQLATLPQIFIKEAQTVKRSLIWEGSPFQPTLTGMPSPPMRGVGGVPPLQGYVVTTDRQDGLAVTSLRGPEDDPILAHWQRGLGRSVAFTGDLTTRWAPQWTGWGGLESFIAEHVRWAMRPSGSAEARTRIETDGDRSRLVVDLVDSSGERINFASIIGRVAGPDGSSQPIRLRQDGPGRYVTDFATPLPGSYVVAMRYESVAAGERGEGGSGVRGAVQAAVTRPFSDEFRAIEDNAGLLRLVADRTGGRVLPADASQASLWSPPSGDPPIAREPALVLFVILVLGLLLFDVAVRRVRLDLGVVRRAAARAARRGESSAGENVDSLRAARERAQKRMQPVGDTKPSDYSGVKFEAPDPSAQAGPTVIAAGDAATPQDRSAQGAGGQAGGGDEPEGISRLLKAKRRAQDEMGDIGEDTGGDAREPKGDR